MGGKLSRRRFLGVLTGITGGFAVRRSVRDAESAAEAEATKPAKRSNILWLIAEDMGPDLGCYAAYAAGRVGESSGTSPESGRSAVCWPVAWLPDSGFRTPNLDKLAGEGALFRNAFTTAPVCSPSRSGLITGMYQTSIGAHHHRSHRKDGYVLPEGVKLITDYFRSQGYFTANVRDAAPGVRGTCKTDFNFTAKRPFDGDDWSQRREGQPFFAQVNFAEAHRGPSWPKARKQKYLVDPAKVVLPPYYPDHPVVRDDFANYLDAIMALDAKVGAVLNRLEKEGLADNTAVFFFADNGRCHIRGKQWLYDAGIHVPLIARWPGRIKPGRVRDDLVSAIDISATSLRLAGIKLPEKTHGRVFLGPEARERKYIFAARDRCDETVDRIRCVRTKSYKYIRNYCPERPYTQPNKYIENNYPTLRILRMLQAEGKLTPAQALFMQPRKPVEELYDAVADPHEVNNLAESPAHQKALGELRQALDRWIAETGDMGRFPEESPEF